MQNSEVRIKRFSR